MKRTPLIATLLLAFTAIAYSQDKLTSAAPDKPHDVGTTCAVSDSCVLRTFYLANISQTDDAKDVVTALRNLLDPHVRIYWVASQNAIEVEAPPDQITLAERVIHDLDRAKKTYRLTYTLTEMDGKAIVGTQHFSMIVVAGQHTSLKQGTKVPVATGSYSAGSAGPNGVQTQFTYLDVGLNIDAALDEFATGVRLQSKVEQSSLGEPATIAGVVEPVVRQVVLQGTSFLSPGKPVILGSIDIPGTTRHDDITVVMDQVQ